MREIKGRHPNLVINIFTSYDLPECRRIAEEYGAGQFLLKGALAGAEIAAIVKAVMEKKREAIEDRIEKGGIFTTRAFCHPNITVSPDTGLLLIVDIMTRKHIPRIPLIEAGACSA